MSLLAGVRDHRRVIVTLQTQRVRTLEQVRAFLEGSEAVDFAGGDREGVYALVRRTLVKLGYHRLGKADKGLVKRYLGKVTGLSRAQLTRLIARRRETGRVEDRRRARGRSPAARPRASRQGTASRRPPSSPAARTPAPGSPRRRRPRTTCRRGGDDIMKHSVVFASVVGFCVRGFEHNVFPGSA